MSTEPFLLTVRRKGRSEWDYSLLLPRAWLHLPAPPHAPDLANPGEHVALGVFSPTATLVPPVAVVVCARPAPRRGAVADWLEERCRAEGLVIEQLGAIQLGEGAAVEAAAVRQAQPEVVRYRVVALEDGGRLVSLVAQAPLGAWNTHAATFERALSSFTLCDAKGATRPLV